MGLGKGKSTIYPFFQWDVISQKSCDIMSSQNGCCVIIYALSWYHLIAHIL